jgi:hypothetical protein
VDFTAIITTNEEKMSQSKHAQEKSITVGIAQTIPNTLHYSSVATPQ